VVKFGFSSDQNVDSPFPPFPPVQKSPTSHFTPFKNAPNSTFLTYPTFPSHPGSYQPAWHIKKRSQRLGIAESAKFRHQFRDSMSLLDFILNIAALLLWLNWRSRKLMGRTPPWAISIASALKRTEPQHLRTSATLAMLLALLVVRAFFYWDIGPSLNNWTGSLDLVAIALPWRSDHFLRILLYSFVSFGLTLGVFYSSLLLISVVNRRVPDTEIGQKFVRVHLGFLEKLPWPIKLLLPIIVSILAWAAIYPLLQKMGIVPAVKSRTHLWEQAAVLGISSLLAWRWIVIGLCALHLLNTYIYLGEHPFWRFVSLTARNLLRPIAFFRIGPLDFSPILGIAFALFLGEFAPRPLSQLFRNLPL
jgi:hypothetical protein